MFLTRTFVYSESYTVQTVDLDVYEGWTNELSSKVDVAVRTLLANEEWIHDSFD